LAIPDKTDKINIRLAIKTNIPPSEFHELTMAIIYTINSIEMIKLKIDINMFLAFWKLIDVICPIGISSDPFL
jgi:hypothetical protein